LQFLNVRRVIVAASKIDLAGAEHRETMVERLRDELRDTIASDAPIHPVSARTGENVPALRAALHDALAALPPPDQNAPVYLPVDRVFTLPGLGTIVTGTLMQGSIAAGDTLALEPGGKPAHVRSIGVFGSTRERVDAGARVALNLPGIDRREVERGQAIVGPELSARRSFTVHFTPLESATALVSRRTSVRAYIGSAEIFGTLVGTQLHLREPVVAFPGLRFVLRRPSPMTLLGGGFVEGTELAPRAQSAPSGEDAVFALLRESGIAPVERNAIAFAANLRESAAQDLLDALVERGDVIRVSRPTAYVTSGAANELLANVVAKLEEAHRNEPWAMGLTSIALARALGVPETTLVRVAEGFVQEGRLSNRAGYYALVSHRPALTPEQRIFFEYLVPVDEAQPLLPIPFAGAASAVKLSHLTGISKAFDTLLGGGALVKVGDNLYRATQIAQVREHIETHFRANERMTAAEFRDMVGTSRKYAVPLLEWLDAHGVTIRDGDYRRLRKKAVPIA
jgi:selenocysteine-specific elongation factor